MAKEEWRDIPSMKGYEASSRGRIRRTHAAGAYKGRHVLRQYARKDGYRCISLRPMVHPLIAEAFIGPRPVGAVLNHKDGDKGNARPDNLEYVTPSENGVHAYENGLNPRGAAHGRAKLSAEDVLAIRERYDGKMGSQSQLAREYGVSQGLVSQIVRGEIWTHLQTGAVRQCEEGRRRGEKHPQSSVTEDAVREIRRRYAGGGVTHEELATEFGVSRVTVSRIVRRCTWQHVE